MKKQRYSRFYPDRYAHTEIPPYEDLEAYSIYLIKRYKASFYMSIQDIDDVSMMAYALASHTFDPDKNCRFSTHWQWKIRGEMSKATFRWQKEYKIDGLSVEISDIYDESRPKQIVSYEADPSDDLDRKAFYDYLDPIEKRYCDILEKYDFPLRRKKMGLRKLEYRYLSKWISDKYTLFHQEY